MVELVVEIFRDAGALPSTPRASQQRPGGGLRPAEGLAEGLQLPQAPTAGQCKTHSPP